MSPFFAGSAKLSLPVAVRVTESPPQSPAAVSSEATSIVQGQKVTPADTAGDQSVQVPILDGANKDWIDSLFAAPSASIDAIVADPSTDTSTAPAAASSDDSQSTAVNETTSRRRAYYTLDFRTSMAIIWCGTALGVAVSATMATIGPKTGLRMMAASRFAGGWASSSSQCFRSR
ncbi:hypothetical protein JCM10213_006585 [Rhodosporidiobolus nylandii]